MGTSRAGQAERQSKPIKPKGDICVVSGGAGGLGQSVCRCLAEAGVHVVVVDISKNADTLAKQLLGEGLMASAVICDVSDQQAVQEMRDRVLREHSRVDATICMAGGFSRNAKLGDVAIDDFDSTITSHVRSTLNIMQAFVPSMSEQRYGRIVTTSSVATKGIIAGTSYAAAKGAIEAMTRTAAIELARFGIAINCIAPGGTNVGMSQRQPEKAREHMIKRTPMRRMAEPVEIAVCYRFLASREASFITGQTLNVCGGASIGTFV